MPKNKQKGSKAERQLVEFFWNTGTWSALRIAGSGRMNYPSPDVLASNGAKILAIECKATKKINQYFRKDQVEQLIQFSRLFGADPLIAIKFSASWHFFGLDDLKQTPSGEFVIKKGTKSREFSEIL